MDSFQKERELWDSRLENVRLDAASGATHDLSHPTFTQAKTAVRLLCSQSSLSTLLLETQHLSPRAPTCPTSFRAAQRPWGTPSDESQHPQHLGYCLPKAGFRAGMLRTVILTRPECHTECVLSSHILLSASLYCSWVPSVFQKFQNCRTSYCAIFQYGLR